MNLVETMNYVNSLKNSASVAPEIVLEFVRIMRSSDQQIYSVNEVTEIMNTLMSSAGGAFEEEWEDDVLVSPPNKLPQGISSF
jgi:histone deacetylase complex regulatory component SIN3